MTQTPAIKKTVFTLEVTTMNNEAREWARKCLISAARDILNRPGAGATVTGSDFFTEVEPK